MCATVNRTLLSVKMVSNVCREVDEVMKERDLDEEKNMTDLEKRN